jgi:hypothetical protein
MEDGERNSVDGDSSYNGQMEVSCGTSDLKLIL